VFVVQRNSQAAVLLSEVFEFMDVVEQDYFGLTYDDDGKMVHQQCISLL